VATTGPTNGVGQGRGKFVATEHAVALILGDTKRTAEAYPKILEAIGTSLDWQFGALWEEVRGGVGLLRCAEVWCSDDARLSRFARESSGTVLARGVGLPGRVWSSGTAAWVTDVRADSNFPRAHAAAANGLRAAFCFPIRSARAVSGVIEFLTDGSRDPDDELLATMETLGSQIGQFVERGRAEDAVREREERYAGILDSALDSIITIDDRGRVLEFNAAAERMFGYRAEEIVGCEMAELIVPPALRNEHRRGFTRHLETGEARLLNRRVEIIGARADGSEFPVELTITRIGLPGQTIFTGFVRDITDRRRAEEELRASRQRLVEAQDTERQRLERNLHDGAQQRLVSLALALRLARERATGAPKAATDLLEQAAAELALALEELRELARGIHPAILTERGLRPALEGLADRATIPVELEELPAERLPEQVEAAAYYVVCEALANVAKYAQASAGTVAVRREDGRVVVEVTDDGIGGADSAKGSGLRGLADRVEALNGRLAIESERASGTRLRAEIPLP
jgi:PAS domain S-box-containing protein